MSNGAPMQTVYCVPIDEQGDEIQQDPVVQIPLDSIYSDQQSTNTLLRMLLNFGGVAVFIIGIMAGTPFLYKTFIVDIIKNDDDKYFNYDDPSEQSKTITITKPQRLAFADALSVVLIAVTSLLLLSGFASNDELGAMFGVFFIIGLFIAFARIQFERINGAEEYYKGLFGIEQNEFIKIGDAIKNIKKIISSRFYEKNINKYKEEFKVNNVLLIVVALIIVLITLYSTLSKSKNAGVYFFIIWFCIYLPSFLQIKPKSPEFKFNIFSSQNK
jgi:hypothetical protein